MSKGAAAYATATATATSCACASGRREDHSRGPAACAAGKAPAEAGGHTPSISTAPAAVARSTAASARRAQSTGPTARRAQAPQTSTSSRDSVAMTVTHAPPRMASSASAAVTAPAPPGPVGASSSATKAIEGGAPARGAGGGGPGVACCCVRDSAARAQPLSAPSVRRHQPDMPSVCRAAASAMRRGVRDARAASASRMARAMASGSSWRATTSAALSTSSASYRRDVAEVRHGTPAEIASSTTIGDTSASETYDTRCMLPSTRRKASGGRAPSTRTGSTQVWRR